IASSREIRAGLARERPPILGHDNMRHTTVGKGSPTSVTGEAARVEAAGGSALTLSLAGHDARFHRELWQKGGMLRLDPGGDIFSEALRQLQDLIRLFVRDHVGSFVVGDVSLFP